MLINMLIVEDQDAMRSALREFLHSAYPEATILEAADGTGAMELCRGRDPGLVLMDVGLPDANGIELTVRIKALLPDCRVIVVSQHAVPAYAERALAAGAFAYVNKDAIYHKLLLAVAAAIGSAPASRPE